MPGLRADGGILGVAYGRGVLIEAGGERTYYNVIAGPPGAILGLDGKSLVLFFSTQDALQTPGRAGLGGGRERRHPDPGRAGPDGAARSGPGPIAGFILADDHLARGLSLSGSLFIKVPMFLCSDASAACAADGAMPQGR